MKRKFAFIGAGSLDFTRGLVRDILTFDAFRDCEIMLMDINETRLKYAKMVLCALWRQESILQSFMRQLIAKRL